MSPHYQDGSLSPEFEDKSRPVGHHGHHVFDGIGPQQLPPGFQGPGLNGLTEGLQTMALVMCRSCWNPCGVSNGVYEPLSGTETNGYNYGTSLNRPYEVEKPPSAQVSQPEVYVPPTLASSVSNAFPATDTGMVSTYAPQYQPLQEIPSHTMAPQNSGHESVVYPVDVPTSVYYSDTSGIPGDDAINFPNLANADRHLSTGEDDPKGPCVGCKPKTTNNHHKQLFRQPCVRRKITECNFFKRGQAPGYEWTRRWGNGIVDNINNWASSEVKTIRLWEGYTPADMCVQLHVRKFIPQPGDKLERTWVAKGVKKSVAIPTYAITNLDEAQAAYEDYIKRGVVGCFKSVIESVISVQMGVRDQLIYNTYLKAWELSQSVSTPPDERDLLLQTLELWMAVRLTTKSIEIVGDETLGMNRDILDSSSPQHGCIPLPPVMGAQLDLILIHNIQARLRREMLEKLQKMTLQNKQKTWLTTYLVTFMLLHNIALVTDHDASYAQKHGMGKKFARESDVQEYHLGGTILLAYFHYCNKGIYPFSEECRDQDLRTLAQLDEDAVQFIHWTRSQAMAHKHEWEEVQQANQYEQPYFFVSQLFQRDWQPQMWAY
ncbi:hypothetical protein CSUB01_02451 [Colletotrichum sublineola]|uniref:Uncharacterized protein n=1 Tax=Colletotrichum sublineola TaxID=1173701 RepID=A0A066WZX6_COLSU|nr:hypothetical protein CSUB01_02451 [Colletotrichum sublineola]